MIIRPSAEIRNNYPELAKLCKETGAPIYITVNGKGDTALIDIETLEELYARINLFEKISIGLNDIENKNTLSHDEIFKKFRG